VEVTLARVRRERMGHIELAVPVSHIWFYKCMPSRLGLMLDMSARQLERVIYYEDYIVVDPGQTPLQKTQLLNEVEFREAQEQYGEGFNAGMGAEAVKKLLAEIDLHKLNKELEQAMGNTKSKQIRKKLAKRLKLVQGFISSHARPEWIAEIRKYVQGDEIVVPPDRFFAMGDNRDNSSDSRYWGFVDRDAIMGRPFVIYWSVDATTSDYAQNTFLERLAGVLDTLRHLPARTRWNRMFHTVH
jgi:hypothetical protein